MVNGLQTSMGLVLEEVFKCWFGYPRARHFDPPIYILKVWINEINKKCTCCSTVDIYVLNYLYFYLLTIISYNILKEKNTLYCTMPCNKYKNSDDG
jgi:hypothetical protein